VFENESHASMHSSKTKEGLSIFGSSPPSDIQRCQKNCASGILNNTKTVLGRSLMRQWLLRPSLSLSIIKARHDAVECFMRPENQVPASLMEAHLKGIKNMPRILNTMQSGRAKLSDWQHLIKVTLEPTQFELHSRHNQFTLHTAMLWDTLHDLCNITNGPIIKEVISHISIAMTPCLWMKVGNCIGHGQIQRHRCSGKWNSKHLDLNWEADLTIAQIDRLG
jgi:DNA mismatch repair protein MSH5